MPPIIVPGKPLPTHSSYASDTIARKFWRLSFKGGRRYVHGEDATGRPVIPPHERENEGYERRKQLTKPRFHAGPIIRRYNDHAFRRKAERQVEGADAVYRLLVEDADGHGTPLPEFMKRACLKAQVDRECYILPDSTKPEGAEGMTQAQAEARGVRPFLRMIPADAVVWWRDHDGVLAEAIVLLVDEQGVEFGRLYGANTTRDVHFKLGEDGKPDKVHTVAAVDDEKPHPYGGCPLVRLRPLFDDDESDGEPGESQISPLAESQQAIANYLSLLNEELYNVTFSQVVATGVSSEQVKGVPVGNNRVICIPNPAGSWDTIGADPAQGESIRKSIIDEQRELYRIAGVDAGSSVDGGGQAESGLAKAFKHNDLAANLAALALACQAAENLAMRRVFKAAGKPVPTPAKYPSEFDLPTLTDELNETIRAVVTPQLPRVLRRKLVQKFAARNFELDQDEQDELNAELESLDEEPANDPPAARTRST